MSFYVIIVVGIADKQLSEKLQRDDKLTPEKAVTQVRQAEQIHQQQRQLNAPDQQQAVNAISSNQAGPGHNTKFSSAHQKGKGQQGHRQPSCPWCGKHRHDCRQCPARDVDCRKCGKHGHFDKGCKSSTDKAMHAVEDDIDSLLLGSVDALTGKDLWLVKLQVNGKQMEFRIDTGADATCIPADSLDNSIIYRYNRIICIMVWTSETKSHLSHSCTLLHVIIYNTECILCCDTIQKSKVILQMCFHSVCRSLSAQIKNDKIGRRPAPLRLLHGVPLRQNPASISLHVNNVSLLFNVFSFLSI
jgi:hypothetical protein